ncbi:hypothetical protein [Pseudoclavibacter sp. JSM 162008]|uniref:hypothetical protein n=1 Tax=Pseudoclavibacter sp. JSM 162008 TaxID=3229855 RepID=UPI0035232019
MGATQNVHLRKNIEPHLRQQSRGSHECFEVPPAVHTGTENLKPRPRTGLRAEILVVNTKRDWDYLISETRRGEDLRLIPRENNDLTNTNERTPDLALQITATVYQFFSPPARDHGKWPGRIRTNSKLSEQGRQDGFVLKNGQH